MIFHKIISILFTEILIRLINSTFLSFTIISLSILASLWSEDRIKTTEGKILKVELITITNEIIYYRSLQESYSNDYLEKIPIQKVDYVIYENGDFVSYKNPISSKKPDHYFLIGVGMGRVYGGITGIMIQYRWQFVALQAGVGYMTYAPILGTGGIKFFFYDDFYINLQFGMLGVQGQHILNRNSEIIRAEVLNYTYGPSLLLGFEWSWGGKNWENFFQIGIDCSIGVSYQLNSLTNNSFGPAFGIGLILKFI